jgi:hypothetical protein
MPYVIAVNAADVMLTDRDFEETLFGVRPGITISGMTHKLARGFWGTENGPQHQRVSAVLFTKDLWPATVLMGQVYACVYLNPWATGHMKACSLTFRRSELKTANCENIRANLGMNL